MAAISEKQIEKQSKKEAKDDGWLAFKFSSPQHRGVFDDVFIKQGRVVFIEFKKPGGVLTRLQEIFRDQIREQKIEAEVAWSVVDTRRILGLPDRPERVRRVRRKVGVPGGSGKGLKGVSWMSRSLLEVGKLWPAAKRVRRTLDATGA